MMTLVLPASALCVLAAALLTRPLWRRASAGLAAALAVFVCGVAAAGYQALGTPERPPEPAATAPAPAVAQVEAMVERLAKRLETQPDDAAGWQMLARSHAVLGRHAKAVEAYRQALRLRPDDATLLADAAFAIATARQRRFEGEPRQLVERALKVEPKNAKALALAGTVAFERKDYRGAVAHWEALARVEPPDGPLVPQIRASIAQARQLAGMAPSVASP